MRSLSLLAALLVGAGLAACDDPTGGQLDVEMVTDTLTLAAPTAPGTATASAFDLTMPPGLNEFGGPRFPELPADPGAGSGAPYDIVLRRVNGELSLVTAAGSGVATGNDTLASASVARVTGSSFEDLSRVPSGLELSRTTPVPVRQGEVYVVRTRLFQLTAVQQCQQYVKLQALAVRPDSGTVRLGAAGNPFCFDTRLTNTDD